MAHPEKHPNHDSRIVSNKRSLDQFVIGNDVAKAVSLMNAAANEVCRITVDAVTRLKLEEASIIVLCGPGNNGGDGMAVAAKLKALLPKSRIEIYRLPTQTAMTPETKHVFKQLPDKLPIHSINKDDTVAQETLKTTLRHANIIIDALFGVGLNRPLEDVAQHWVSFINLARSHDGAHVISIDIPSGLNSQTGYLDDSKHCVIADETVIFTAYQPGHWLQEGRRVCGRRHCVSIGIPDETLAAFLDTDSTRPLYVLNDTWAKRILPKRPENSHKGSFGHVLVIAGSRRMPGAAYLTAMTALKAGAGKVTLAAPESVFQSGSFSLAPEIMRYPLPETADGQLSASSIDALEMNLSQFNSIAVGPGLGLSPNTQAVFNALLNVLLAIDTPIILDADALTLWSQARNKLTDKIIVTPHLGEGSRMLGLETAMLQRDIIAAAHQLESETGANVLLKASGSVLIPQRTQSQLTFMSQAGNNGMATAGSGDVLTGLIAGFLAQGARIPDAMALGVHLHGRAGDLACQDLTAYCLSASDLISYLPQAIKAILSDAPLRLCP